MPNRPRKMAKKTTKPTSSPPKHRPKTGPSRPKPKRRAQPVEPVEEEKDDALTLAEVEADIEAVGVKRAQAAALADEVKAHQARVVEAFQHDPKRRKSYTVERGGQKWSVTFVEGESVVLDEAKLKKRLGAALWNKITTRSLDRKKLDAFIAAGEVATSDVAACSDLIPKTPHTRVSKK